VRKIRIPRRKDWEADPYVAAAVVIRDAVNRALDFQGTMNDHEAQTLTKIYEEVSH
jgi:hypothetical protein